MYIGCLDLESTGAKPDKDRIIEIAVLVWDTVQKREVLAFERRINPGMPIQPGAIAVHGITEADIIKCPGFEVIAGSVVQLLAKLDVLMGHNMASFDAVMLIHEFVRVGSVPKRMPFIFDTMLEGRGCTDDGKIPTLGELCYALDVPYDKSKAHAAMYDVRCNMQAFLRGVELGVFALPEAEELKVAA